MPGLFSELKDAVTSSIAGVLVGKAGLMYQAGFENENLEPLYDLYDFGPMQLNWTGNLDGRLPVNALEVIPGTVEYPLGGVRLTSHRPAPIDKTTILNCVLHGFPADATIFRIRAQFSSPAGPHGSEDSWAMAIMARKAGGPPEPDTREERITVTLQPSYNTGDSRPGARMNTVGGAKPGTLPPYPQGGGAGSGTFIPDEVFMALFASDFVMLHRTDDEDTNPLDRDPIPEPFVHLQMDVDRYSRLARASVSIRAWRTGVVTVPGSYAAGFATFSESRSFIHPFIPIISPTTGAPNVLGATGFGLGVAGGTGPASVTVREFKVYVLKGGWDFMHELAGSTWLGTGFIGPILRDIRARLIDWAFAPVLRREADASQR